MKRDEGTLLDIANAAHAVLTFVQGLQKEQFLEDFKTQSAVLYQLIVLGKPSSGSPLNCGENTQRSHGP
jgi:uncharacterized protein with HEPN domain